VKTVSQTVGSRKPRLLVVDDSVVAREGMIAIINRYARYVFCGAAADRGATFALMEECQPDLVLVEPFLRNGDGLS
jgi:chemotaxis response regulator CheB